MKERKEKKWQLLLKLAIPRASLPGPEVTQQRPCPSFQWGDIPGQPLVDKSLETCPRIIPIHQSCMSQRVMLIVIKRQLGPGFLASFHAQEASLVAQLVKNLPAVQETWVPSLGWEDPLEKGMATHSSILAWRISWTEGPGGLQSVRPQTVEYN